MFFAEEKSDEETERIEKEINLKELDSCSNCLNSEWNYSCAGGKCLRFKIYVTESEKCDYWQNKADNKLITIHEKKTGKLIFEGTNKEFNKGKTPLRIDTHYLISYVEGGKTYTRRP